MFLETEKILSILHLSTKYSMNVSLTVSLSSSFINKRDFFALLFILKKITIWILDYLFSPFFRSSKISVWIPFSLFPLVKLFFIGCLNKCLFTFLVFTRITCHKILLFQNVLTTIFIVLVSLNGIIKFIIILPCSVHF